MSILEAIISRVAPHNCLVCGQEGSLLCVWCQIETLPALPARCYNCFTLSEASKVCQRCRRLSPLKHVWVRTDYESTAKQLIHAYKFDHARAGAGLIAGFMKEALPYIENAIVVPVPTASSRVRLRGFDHTALLAKQLAKQTGLAYLPALKRVGQSKQVGTKRAVRKAQMKGAFRSVVSLKGQHVLLIDDVVTTGATLEEAARTCRRAGAKTIDALVFTQRQ